MPLPVVYTQPLFHSSLCAFQHCAAVTHHPNRAGHDKALNDASPKQEILCQEQRLLLDRQGSAQGEKKRGVYLTLEEERFSSGYGHLSKGRWVNRARWGWDSKPGAQGILPTKPMKCVASSYESSGTSVGSCLVGMLFKVAASRHKPAHSEQPVGTPAVSEDCPLQGQHSTRNTKWPWSRRDSKIYCIRGGKV